MVDLRRAFLRRHHQAGYKRGCSEHCKQGHCEEAEKPKELTANQVKIANRHNISFYATGGAHGAEPGFANVKNSVNIDLGNFDKLIVDPQANILTVGANITFSQIFEPLYNVSKELRMYTALVSSTKQSTDDLGFQRSGTHHASISLAPLSEQAWGLFRACTA